LGPERGNAAMNEQRELSSRESLPGWLRMRGQPARWRFLACQLADHLVEIGKRIVQFALAKNGGSDVITLKFMVAMRSHIPETHNCRK
jgi:hypothetical protein